MRKAVPNNERFINIKLPPKKAYTLMVDPLDLKALDILTVVGKGSMVNVFSDTSRLKATRIYRRRSMDEAVSFDNDEELANEMHETINLLVTSPGRMRRGKKGFIRSPYTRQLGE